MAEIQWFSGVSTLWIKPVCSFSLRHLPDPPADCHNHGGSVNVDVDIDVDVTDAEQVGDRAVHRPAVPNRCAPGRGGGIREQTGASSSGRAGAPIARANAAQLSLFSLASININCDRDLMPSFA
jgi:hypothetical protein